jgi:hypothetical protein
MVKKVLKWAGLAFLVYFVAFRPQSAANFVTMVGDTLLNTANGLGEFVASVFA